jgi:U3 small nucleolar RNA-associated protein 6
MPGASDKAQHYLERSVPQLQELLRKEVFTPTEIKSITRKRSDYEHTINARGQTAADYASYAAYEINLASLIKKRTTRLKVKLAVSAHDGPRRVYFILERGVRKFPGDLGLWMQLLGYARKERARKKVRELVTQVLRLHPAKASLWVWTANAVLEDEADMSAARGYLQRGLRFCKRERSLWIEYARLECIYIAKIAARRRILGLEGRKEKELVDEGEDMLALAPVTAEDINPSLDVTDGVDDEALKNLASTPALTGAIPIAIFDAAMKEFENDASLGEEFFDMVAEFERGTTFDRILRHVVEALEKARPDDAHTITVQFMLPITGLTPESPEFPEALTATLKTIRQALSRLPLQRKEIASSALARLLPLAATKDLDADIAAAVHASIRTYVKAVGSAGDVVPIVQRLQEGKQDKAAKLLLDIAVKVLPEDVKLTALKGGLGKEKQRSQELLEARS